MMRVAGWRCGGCPSGLERDQGRRDAPRRNKVVQTTDFREGVVLRGGWEQGTALPFTFHRPSMAYAVADSIPSPAMPAVERITLLGVRLLREGSSDRSDSLRSHVGVALMKAPYRPGAASKQYTLYHRKRTSIAILCDTLDDQIIPSPTPYFTLTITITCFSTTSQLPFESAESAESAPQEKGSLLQVRPGLASDLPLSINYHFVTAMCWATFFKLPGL